LNRRRCLIEFVTHGSRRGAGRSIPYDAIGSVRLSIIIVVIVLSSVDQIIAIVPTSGSNEAFE